MANHWSNIVKFRGNQEQVNALLESIKGDDGRLVDFNKITPIPRWIYGADPSDTGITKEDKEKYGKENISLNWRREHWGTKWNAYEMDYNAEKNELFFRTANGAAPYLFQKLAWIYPEVEITYECYDTTDPFFGNIYTFEMKDTDFEETSRPMLTEEELREEMPELFEDID